MKYRNAPTNYEEWLKDRKENPSIGASQSAAVLGLSPWATPFDVWHELVNGFEPKEENLTFRLGRELEPIIRTLFMEETGLKVINDNKIRYSNTYPYITTNLDGMVVGEKVPVEYKTTALGWDGEIPDQYFVQLQHQMYVTETTHCYFAILSLGFKKELIIQKYERDDSFIDNMVTELVRFWEEYVDTKEPPPLLSISDAKKLYFNEEPDSIIQADDEIYMITKSLQHYENEKKRLDDNIAKSKLQLMTVLENKQELQYNGTTLVTWKQTKPREYFDKNTFKKEHPDIYSKYSSKREGARRFTLKKMEL
tara:strand:- start:1039 stop:1965 length:927 start_codon:yes stop_codon:yes gene_type:complete